MRLRSARRLIRNRSGASAVEFALVAPAFLALTIGSIYMAMLVFAYANLQSTVEEAARCASVRTTICFDQTSVSTFATGRYQGPGVSPVFTYVVAPCGHQVTASGSLTLISGLPGAGGVKPFTVTACHP